MSSRRDAGIGILAQPALRELARPRMVGKILRPGLIVLRERYVTLRQERAHRSAGIGRNPGGELPKWASAEDPVGPGGWADLPVLLPVSSSGLHHRRFRSSWAHLQSWFRSFWAHFHSWKG